MRALCERDHPPGVVTYLDGVAVGWCNIGPRSEIPRLVHRPTLLTDDLPVWSIICLVVRGGHRRKGVVGHLLEGAVAYAAANGAPAVEAHPVDPPGRMDTTMAFVGNGADVRGRGSRRRQRTDACGEPDAAPRHAPHPHARLNHRPTGWLIRNRSAVRGFRPG